MAIQNYSVKETLNYQEPRYVEKPSDSWRRAHYLQNTQSIQKEMARSSSVTHSIGKISRKNRLDHNRFVTLGSQMMSKDASESNLAN